MGNLNALPALDVRTPTPPDALSEFARVAQIRSSMQAQQAQAQEMQVRQQQIKDQQATTAAMQNWDPSTGDYDGLAKSVLQNGGSANAATAIQQHGIQVKQATQGLQKGELDNYLSRQKATADMLQPLTDANTVPDEQLQKKSLDTVVGLVNNKLLDPAHGQQYAMTIQQTNDPTALRNTISQLVKTTQGAAATAAQAKTAAETAAETGKARESNAAAVIKEIEAKGLQGITPEYINQTAQDPITRQAAMAAVQRGDVQGAKDALKSGFESALSQQKEISEKLNPAVRQAEIHDATAKKAAEQAITDGDPKAAGQLLVSGAVAPSQLVSSRKPAFAQQAFSEAQKLDPSWNATKADADFAVSKSPANLAFFGSAKSLTDKGGTLDQLKDAAKDIPEHQIPVFNTVDDWMKASTGSGPIAKYAALALGVADDYSKVMGGGQGSDTSRVQALNLIGAKQSPEQKQASLEGIRGAVNSQKNSRIGSNRILQQMYGDGAANQTQKKDFFSQFGGQAR